MRSLAVLIIAASIPSGGYSQSLELFDSSIGRNWDIQLPKTVVPAFQTSSMSMSCGEADCSLFLPQTNQPFIEPLTSVSGIENRPSFLVYRPEINKAASQYTHLMITGSDSSGDFQYGTLKPLSLTPALVITSSAETLLLMDTPVYHWLVVDSALSSVGSHLPDNVHSLEAGEGLRLTLPFDQTSQVSRMASVIEVSSDLNGKMDIYVPGQEPPSDSGNGKKVKESWDDPDSEDDSSATGINKGQSGSTKKSQASSGGDKPPKEDPPYKAPLPAAATPVLTLQDMTSKQLLETLKKAKLDPTVMEPIIYALITKCKQKRKTRGQERYGNKSLKEAHSYIENNHDNMVLPQIVWEKLKSVILE